MCSYIGIDEVALSQGELYTVLVNKAAHGKRGSIIAIIKGTEAKTVCGVLLKMSRKRRFQAREITLDIAPNMSLIVFMYRNWVMRLFNKCESMQDGRH